MTKPTLILPMDRQTAEASDRIQRAFDAAASIPADVTWTTKEMTRSDNEPFYLTDASHDGTTIRMLAVPVNRMRRVSIIDVWTSGRERAGFTFPNLMIPIDHDDIMSVISAFCTISHGFKMIDGDVASLLTTTPDEEPIHAAIRAALASEAVPRELMERSIAKGRAVRALSNMPSSDTSSANAILEPDGDHSRVMLTPAPGSRGITPLLPEELPTLLQKMPALCTASTTGFNSSITVKISTTMRIDLDSVPDPLDTMRLLAGLAPFVEAAQAIASR